MQTNLLGQVTNPTENVHVRINQFSSMGHTRSWILSFQLYELNPLHSLKVQDLNRIAQRLKSCVSVVIIASKKDQKRLIKNARLLLVLSASVDLGDVMRIHPFLAGHIECVVVIENFCVMASVNQNLISIGLHGMVSPAIRERLLPPNLIELVVYLEKSVYKFVPRFTSIS